MSSLAMWKETYKKMHPRKKKCDDILFHRFEIIGQQFILLLMAHKLAFNIWNYLTFYLFHYEIICKT